MRVALVGSSRWEHKRDRDDLGCSALIIHRGSMTSYTLYTEGTNLKEGRGAFVKCGCLNLKGREDEYDTRRGAERKFKDRYVTKIKRGRRQTLK